MAYSRYEKCVATVMDSEEHSHFADDTPQLSSKPHDPAIVLYAELTGLVFVDQHCKLDCKEQFLRL